MKQTNAQLIYFSPTGTTRKILGSIATGIGLENPKEINLTLPRDRKGMNLPLDADLLLFGIPVYEEHIPPVIRPILETLTGDGQNAIIVAVYGNVGFGLALQEMQRLLTSKGFTVIAGAAFIGEHSFSHTGYPIAENRPDKADLEIARDFGRKIANKLSFSSPCACTFPGHLPLMSRILPEGSAVKFAHLPDFEPAPCTLCGRCVKNCPVTAIDFTTMAIDESKCLRCFSCVRICPEKARSIKFKHTWLVKRALKKAATHRQEPQVFL